MLNANSALVVFSGGQDSTTCLGWALQRYETVATIGFSYGQRHSVEMDCRGDVLSAVRGLTPEWDRKLGDDLVLELGLFKELGNTALTDDVQIAMGENGLPNTFVPGRNLVFMTAAAAYAYRQGIKHIITGVCETDYSGYPDCRDDTLKALQIALNLGMDTRFALHTPLMWIDKAQTWSLAKEVGGEAFVELVREKTHTCYNGVRDTLHAWGYGCNDCPACELRAAGWQEYCDGGL